MRKLVHLLLSHKCTVLSLLLHNSGKLLLLVVSAWLVVMLATSSSLLSTTSSTTSAALISSLLDSIGPLDIGLPPSLHQLLSDHSNDQGTARGGCDDGFGVFGFLAFLLALLDLLLDLGGDGRKKRSSGDEGMCDLPNPHPQVREGTLAALVMLRGFLNAVEPLEETDSQECAALAICEASTEAARLGEVGRVVAQAAGANAAAWLGKAGVGDENALKEAAQAGHYNGLCEQWVCEERPQHYRHPATVSS